MSSCDFAECLRLAKELSEYTERLKTFATEHGAARDDALTQWHGWYGDHLRTEATDNDWWLRVAVLQLENASDDWVEVWRQEVDRHNDEEFQRALDAPTFGCAVENRSPH